MWADVRLTGATAFASITIDTRQWSHFKETWGANPWIRRPPVTPILPRKYTVFECALIAYLGVLRCLLAEVKRCIGHLRRLKPRVAKNLPRGLCHRQTPFSPLRRLHLPGASSTCLSMAERIIRVGTHTIFQRMTEKLNDSVRIMSLSKVSLI